MKKYIAALLLLVAPLSAYADCSQKDFALTDVKVASMGGNRLSIKGKLVNNCAAAAAAQVRVAATDSGGSVVASRDGWPGGTTNLSPGQSVDFDFGRLIHYDSNMQNYTLSVVSVKTW